MFHREAMKHQRSFFYSLLLILSMYNLTHASANSLDGLERVSFIGSAYQSGLPSLVDNLLYTEHHTVYQNKQGEYVESEVEYRSPAGETLAKKNLKFSNHQTLPELKFNDLRTGTAFVTKNSFDTENPHVRISSRQIGPDDELVADERVALEMIEGSVVDAGFDLFILRHWKRLLAGDRVELAFLALTRASFYNFYLKQEGINNGVLELSLKPASFFLRLLVEPIYLRYDTTSQRLLSFEGLTNIERVTNGKAEGQNYQARIEYRYLDEYTSSTHSNVFKSVNK